MTKRTASFRGMKISHDFKAYIVTCNIEDCRFEEESKHLYELKDECGKHFETYGHNDFNLRRKGSVDVNP